MESYRYRPTNQADFEKFVGWLIENKCNFFTQHNYIPSAGEHVYHITVTAEPNVLTAFGHFIEVENRTCCALDCTNNLYSTISEIVEDMYADPVTLRKALTSTLDLTEELNTQIEESNGEKAKLEGALKSEKENKQLYLNLYSKAIEDNNRVRKQVRAISLLMDSIFPKD